MASHATSPTPNNSGFSDLENPIVPHQITRWTATKLIARPEKTPARPMMTFGGSVRGRRCSWLWRRRRTWVDVDGVGPAAGEDADGVEDDGPDVRNQNFAFFYFLNIDFLINLKF